MASINEKLNYLNETKNKIKDGINILGGELTNQSTFRSYANALEEIYNLLPKVTSEESDEDIILNKTNKGKLVLNLNPNTHQDSTTGKNLLSLNNLQTQTSNGVTFTPIYENGKFSRLY